MKIIVIGGHTRNIGKTSVGAALIRGLRRFNWTAVKITQYGHGVCSRDGKPCQCAPTQHAFQLTIETDPRGRADTCRLLAAGAQRSLWLRVREGRLGDAFPTLERSLSGDECVLIESNSILAFLQPVAYLMVVDGTKRDFKDSARKFLRCADALVPVDLPARYLRKVSDMAFAAQPKLIGSLPLPDFLTPCSSSASERGGTCRGEWIRARDHRWPGVEPEMLVDKPLFPVRADDYSNPDLCRFIRSRLE